MDPIVNIFITNTASKSSILTEKVPIIGEISLMFFIPYEFPQRQKLMKLIIDHGGAVVPYNNALCYQIVPDTILVENEEQKLNKFYFNGRVYTHNLITDSINKGVFQDPHDYIGFVIEGGKKIYDRNERRRYTIVEILKMSRIMKNQRPFGKKVWTYSDINNDIPERPAEGMRSTFKKYIKKMYTEENFYSMYCKRERLDRFDELRWAKCAIKDLIRIKARFWDYYMNPVRSHDIRCPFTNIEKLIEDDNKKENMNLPPSLIPIKIEKIGSDFESYWNEINYLNWDEPQDDDYSKIALINCDELQLSQLQFDQINFEDKSRRESTSVRLEWDSVIPESIRSSKLFKREEMFVTSECDLYDQIPNSQFDERLSYIINPNVKLEDGRKINGISNEWGIFTKAMNFKKINWESDDESESESFVNLRKNIKFELCEPTVRMSIDIVKEEINSITKEKKANLTLFKSPSKDYDRDSKLLLNRRKRDSKRYNKNQIEASSIQEVRSSLQSKYEMIDQFIENSVEDQFNFGLSAFSLKEEDFENDSNNDTDTKRSSQVFRITKNAKV